MSLRRFLFENEAVVGISSPMDYFYMKLLRFMLITVGSWPRKEMGEFESRYQTIFLKYLFLGLTLNCVFGYGAYVIIHMNEMSFFEIGHIYIVLLMSAVNSSRVLTLNFSIKYKELVKTFITKIHLFYYKDRSEFAMKTHKKIHLISHLFSLFLLGQMLNSLLLFNLMPMYSNYAAGNYKTIGLTNSTYEHSLYYPYPFDTSTDLKGYIFACIVNWYFSYLTGTWFCMLDLILSLMVFNVWGHFKILINLLNEFPRPSSDSSFTVENVVLHAEKYSKEELLEVAERLKQCIIYHREIKVFTDTMSDVFGPMLFIYYIFHQACGCILLLECSQMTAQALMRYVPLTVILFQQLIQLSVIFELVGSESEKLKDAVYGVPWEYMDTKNRKVVLIFLMNVQEPVHLKALGLADVGVKSMATILKTSLSYFTFLRSK